MKTIFDPAIQKNFIDRIRQLQPDSEAQWGKMNVHQMIRHCQMWNDMVLKNQKLKRVFIGRLLGKLMLKGEMRDQPMRQNNPSAPELIVTHCSNNIEPEKEKWIQQIKMFSDYSIPDYQFVHPFFGKMTKEQIGIHAYKHTDHHLRQFKV